MENESESDYEVGQDNVEGQVGPFGFDIHNPVFLISGISIVAFVFYALALPEQSADLFGWLRPFLTSTFDWFFLGAANIFVLFCLFLIVSPFGKVRLGGMDAKPDYGYIGLVPLWATRRKRAALAWLQPSFIGACTRGRFMRL